MVTQNDIAEFLLGFAAIFGLVMGFGFMFMGIVGNDLIKIIIGFILSITGLFSSLILSKR